MSKNFIEAYNLGVEIGQFSTVSEGVKTGNNDLFLRLWYEVLKKDFSFAKENENYTWYPHHKGGDFRKWYGNREWIINWKNDGRDIKNAVNSGLQGKNMYFAKFLSWSKISSKGNPFRLYSKNFLFDSAAPALSNNELIITLGLLNSKVGAYYLSLINPTVSLQVGDVKKVPLIIRDKSVVFKVVNKCVNLSQADWDYYEISWDFKKHPLV